MHVTQMQNQKVFALFLRYLIREGTLSCHWWDSRIFKVSNEKQNQFGRWPGALNLSLGVFFEVLFGFFSGHYYIGRKIWHTNCIICKGWIWIQTRRASVYGPNSITYKGSWYLHEKYSQLVLKDAKEEIYLSVIIFQLIKYYLIWHLSSDRSQRREMKDSHVWMTSMQQWICS